MKCRNCGKEVKEKIEINVHAFGITPPTLIVCSRKCHRVLTDELSKRYKKAHIPIEV